MKRLFYSFSFLKDVIAYYSDWDFYSGKIRMHKVMKCLWTITGLTIKINIESRYKNHEQVWPCNKNTMGSKDFEVAIEFNKKYINGKPCYKLCQKHDNFAQLGM